MFNLFKKGANFFDLLENQCISMVDGMQALYDYVTTKDKKYAEMVARIEDEGDSKRRILINELNNTLITPIARNDIFNLSGKIDDILDYANTTVDEIKAFNIEPNEDMCSIIEILLEMTKKIAKAIGNMEKHSEISKISAIEVKSLENKVAAKCVESLARLFDIEDWHLVFKYREIYRHLNTTSDIADVAMDSLLDIINTI